jgi:hypothetical protein
VLRDQSRDVKEAAEYVAQLMRVGKGLGVWQWDQALLESLGGEDSSIET